MGIVLAAQVVDVRIIVAANRDLNMAVKEGEFREALLARITAYTIELPPLRRRRPEENTKLAKAIYSICFDGIAEGMKKTNLTFIVKMHNINIRLSS